MIQEEFKKMLFKGAFSMMACDGNIHTNEINEIKALAQNSPYFSDLDYEMEIIEARNELRIEGAKSIERFLAGIGQSDLTEKQELMLIEVLIKIIEADEQIESSELKFMQMIKENLKVNEETLVAKFPTHIDYLLDMEHYGANISFAENIESLNLEALD